MIYKCENKINKIINNKNCTIMEKIITLKNIVAKNAKIIIEYNNNLNVLGITKYKKCYVVSWYNKILNKDKHFVFDTLAKAQTHFNLIMSLQF